MFCQSLTAPVGRVWRLTHFYSVALRLEKRFACHHSTPYFFIILFPTAFYNSSRMTGRYLILFCKKPFYASAHTRPFHRFRFLFSPFKISRQKPVLILHIKKDLPKEVSLIGISDSQIRTCSSGILPKHHLRL